MHDSAYTVHVCERTPIEQSTHTDQSYRSYAMRVV
jgi:hypothetical protein